MSVTLGAGIAALNTGNNLLFLLLALMLSILLFDYTLAITSFRNLSVFRTIPGRAVAGDIFEVEFRVKNESRYLPIYSISITDKINGVRFKRNAYFLKIDPRETRVINYRCEIQNRGTSSFNGFYLSGSFPFGFFFRRKFIKFEDEVLVWPKSEQVHLMNNIQENLEGEIPLNQKGTGDDFWQLSKYQEGDNPSLINWKASFKRDILMIRENEAVTQTLQNIILNLTKLSDEQCEYAISCVAGVVNKLECNDKTDVVVMLINGEYINYIKKCSRSSLMDFLALIDINQKTKNDWNNTVPDMKGRVVYAGRKEFMPKSSLNICSLKGDIK